MTTSRHASADATGSHATTVLGIAASFLAMLDTTVVNVSLHATTDRFGHLELVQWVLTSYLLALCATMAASAWLVGRFGAKRTFVVATAIFGLGSLACAMSPTIEVLIGARAVAGAAAGVLTPVATVLMTEGVPRERIGRVQALNGTFLLVGPLVGPTVGGLLVQYAGGWSAVYWANVPVCVVLCLSAVVRVGSSAPAGRGAPLDVPGLVSGVLAIVAGTWAIGAAGRSLTDPQVWIGLAVAVVAAIAFVVRERAAAAPLLDLSLYRHPVYAWSSLNVVFLGFILYAPMVVIPLYLGSVRGNGSVTTGLLLSTAGVGVLVAGVIVPRLMRRAGGGVTMLIGISLTLVATVPFLTLTGTTSYVLLSAALVVRGAGISMTIVPAMTRAFESVPAEAIRHAAPQLNLLQRIGGSFAATVIIVVLHRAAVSAHGMTAAVFSQASWWIIATSAVTLVPAGVLARVEHRRWTADSTAVTSPAVGGLDADEEATSADPHAEGGAQDLALAR